MRIFFFISFLFLLQAISAQEITVSGVVYDKSFQLPVIGATIKVLNSNKYTLADIDGNYSLVCNLGDKIEVTSFGYETEMWIVDSSIKDFYMEEMNTLVWDGWKTMWLDGFTITSTYSFREKTFGTSFGYTHRFEPRSCEEYGWKPSDRIRNMIRLGAVFAKPNWEKDGLLYPEIQLVQRVFKTKPLTISAGLGYYMTINDENELKNGGMMFSVGVGFYPKNIRRFLFDFSAGYNWFINRVESDHLFLKIAIYPSPKTFGFGGDSHLEKRCNKFIYQDYLIDR